MSKVKTIGIIAEDESDFNCSRVLIQRIINKEGIGFKKSIGNGCGKIRKKVLDFCEDLKNRGCSIVICIHDLDRNNYDVLYKDLNDKLKKNKAKNHFICIPVEEIEAWFLSDPDAIREALNLKKTPNIKFPPETIPSPKEKLEALVYVCSDKEKIYLNTKHNELIAAKVNLNILNNKCSSFNKLLTFIRKHKY